MFRKHISACYDGLTPGYRRLADFILNHPLDVAGMTATELARVVGVEPGTVTRFAQEIGYEGYRGLMQDIRHYVHEQTTAVYRTAAAPTNQHRLAAIQANSLQGLEQLVATQTNSIASALTVLAAASKVCVLGDYVVYEIARVFAQELNCIGRPAAAIAPALTEMAAALTQMQTGQALLVIGLGYTVMDAGYMVRLAREKGLTTLCITPDAALLPAREADITMVTPAISTVGPLSMIPQLLVLNWLWEALTAEKPESIAQIFTAIISGTGRLREWRKEGLMELGMGKA